MKKLLIAAIALIFVACGNNSSDDSSSTTKDSSTTKKPTPSVKEEMISLPLNTTREVKKGYEVQPIGGKASFEIDVQDGRNFVTLRSGKAVIQKSMN